MSRSGNQGEASKADPHPLLPLFRAGQSHMASFWTKYARLESRATLSRNFRIQMSCRTHVSNPKFPHAIALHFRGRAETAARKPLSVYRQGRDELFPPPERGRK